MARLSFGGSESTGMLVVVEVSDGMLIWVLLVDGVFPSGGGPGKGPKRELGSWDGSASGRARGRRYEMVREQTDGLKGCTRCLVQRGDKLQRGRESLIKQEGVTS